MVEITALEVAKSSGGLTVLAMPSGFINEFRIPIRLEDKERLHRQLKLAMLELEAEIQKQEAR